MYIAWIKTKKPMEMYGEIPEVYGSDNAVIFYDDETAAEKICSFLLPLVDRSFANDLSYGDVDFLNAEKCKSLLDILQKHEKQLRMQIGNKIFEILSNSCLEAVKRDTGIVVEL